MPSPQLESGFTRIANSIIEALYRVNTPPYERRVIDFVFRITYGFQRRDAETSISQISRVTGIERRNVQRAIKGLVGKNMLTINYINRDCELAKSIRVAFQKDPAKWIVDKPVHKPRGGASKLTHSPASLLTHPPCVSTDAGGVR